MNSGTLYLLIAFCFAIPYFGLGLYNGGAWQYALLIIGCILFLLRIFRGDD